MAVRALPGAQPEARLVRPVRVTDEGSLVTSTCAGQRGQRVVRTFLTANQEPATLRPLTSGPDGPTVTTACNFGVSPITDRCSKEFLGMRTYLHCLAMAAAVLVPFAAVGSTPDRVASATHKISSSMAQPCGTSLPPLSIRRLPGGGTSYQYTVRVHMLPSKSRLRTSVPFGHLMPVFGSTAFRPVRSGPPIWPSGTRQYRRTSGPCCHN
jgi:hypothetical protein